MKIALLVLAYTLTGFLGWFWAQKEKPAVTAPAQNTKSSRSLAAAASGEQLLYQLIADQRASRKAPEKTAVTLPPSQNAEKAFLDLFSALDSQPENDIKPPFSDSTDLAKLELRFQEWLKENPLAAVQGLKSLEPSELKSTIIESFLWDQLSELLKKDGFQASLSWLPEASTLNPEAFKRAVFGEIGASGSLADLQFIKNHYPAWLESKQSAKALAEQWPFERREELLQNIGEEFRYEAILEIALQKGNTEALDWFLNLYRSEELSKIIRANHKRKDYRIDQLILNSDAPIERRADLAREFGRYRGFGDHAANSQIIYQDLRKFLQNPEHDRLYAFAHGKASPDELYHSLLQEYPTLSTQSDEARSQLFRSLAEIDYEAASTLFQDAGSEAVDWQKLYASRWWFRGANPDTFFEMVQSVNLNFEDPKVSTFLEESWKTKTYTNLADYGADYLSWVRDLPEGHNRNLALQAIVNSRNPLYAEEAANLLDSP